MREKWARRIAFLTGLLVLLLAFLFAFIQNPVESPDSTQSMEQVTSTQGQEFVTLDAEKIKTGQQIYKQQNCARCHSIAGQGNPRNPLDGVGTRHTVKELRNWIIGADSLQGALPTSILKLKQTNSVLSDSDLDALIIYMQSLRIQR